VIILCVYVCVCVCVCVSVHAPKWGNLSLQGEISGDNFGCHNICMWVKAKVATKHFTVHRKAPQQRITWSELSIVSKLRILFMC
jgi:hypothetical protein